MSRFRHDSLLASSLLALRCAGTDTTQLSSWEQEMGELSPPAPSPMQVEEPALEGADSFSASPSEAPVEPERPAPIALPTSVPAPPIGDVVDAITPEMDSAPAPELSAATHPVAFISAGRDSAGNVVPPELFVARADGSDAVRVTSGSLGYLHPQWSPDGLSLAAMGMQPSGLYDIVLISVRDGSATNLTPDTGAFDDTFPTWSPDGQRIVYAAREATGNRRLVVMSRFGGQRRPLLPALDRFQGAVSWSWQDPARLAFSGDDAQGQRNLFLVDPDAAGEPLDLTRGRVISPDRPYWSPDGKRLTFIAFLEPEFENRRVYVLNLETDELVRVSSHDGTEEVPSWSPDGLSLLMTRDTTRDGELWLVPLDPLGTATNFSNRPNTFDGFGTWYVPPRAVLP